MILDEFEWLVFSLAFALALMRINGDTSALFQAIAHTYVGGLFGAGFCGRKPLLYLAIALSVLETVCFLAGVGR